MKTCLVTDGYSIKNFYDALMNEYEACNFNSNSSLKDTMFVCGENTSDPSKILSICSAIENEKRSTKESALLYFAKAVSFMLYRYSLEKRIVIAIFLSDDCCTSIEEAIIQGLLYLPNNIKVVYIRALNQKDSDAHTNDRAPSNLPNESQNDIIQKINTENNNDFSEFEANEPKDRIEMIHSLTKGVSFERDSVGRGSRFSAKQNAIFLKIFRNRNNFTNDEIANALNLPISTIRNKRFFYNSKKEQEKQLEDVSEVSNVLNKTSIRKTDRAANARNERAKQLVEIAAGFIPEYINGSKILSEKSRKELKELFTDSNKNWKISEISKVTGVKKSQVEYAMMQHNEVSVEKDAVEGARDRLAFIMANDAATYRSMLKYNTSLLVENPQILTCSNECGIIPSGDLIQDAAFVLGVTFTKEEENCLSVAFGCLQNFDTDFMNTLIAGNFPYIGRAYKLKPLCTMLKLLRIAKSTIKKASK